MNKMYQRVIEETQPNYTAMQRAGIQRNDSDVVRGLTMFTTQRFQNYGILADAVGDYKAQKARYVADQSARTKLRCSGPSGTWGVRCRVKRCRRLCLQQ